MDKRVVISMSKDQIIIRRIIPSDVDACVRLFHDTVHAINASHYSLAQLNAWAPAIIDTNDERWQVLLVNICLIAEINHEIVGFGDMNQTGYLDRLYVHKDHQGKGIATLLLNELEKQAIQTGLSEINTEASITAKPFFETRGYHLIKENQKYLRGEIFRTYSMKKSLSI